MLDNVKGWVVRIKPGLKLSLSVFKSNEESPHVQSANQVPTEPDPVTEMILK